MFVGFTHKIASKESSDLLERREREHEGQEAVFLQQYRHHKSQWAQQFWCNSLFSLPSIPIVRLGHLWSHRVCLSSPNKSERKRVSNVETNRFVWEFHLSLSLQALFWGIQTCQSRSDRILFPFRGRWVELVHLGQSIHPSLPIQIRRSLPLHRLLGKCTIPWR